MYLFVLIAVVMLVGFGLFMLVAVGLLVYFGRRRAQAAMRSWGDVGQRTGLTFKAPGLFSSPELNGQYRHRAIRVYTNTVGRQGDHTTYTTVRLAVNNPTNSMLDIAPAGLVGNFFTKLLNAQDVEIGNPAFDERYVVRSNPAESAVKVLANSNLPAALMDVPQGFSIQLEGPVLAYAHQNVEGSGECLEKVFNALSDLADGYEALR